MTQILFVLLIPLRPHLLLSFGELSPIPMVKSPNDSSLRKGRNKQESAIVTSVDYWEKLRESRHKGGKREASANKENDWPPIRATNWYGCTQFE
jgi:hypothetical protein